MRTFRFLPLCAVALGLLLSPTAYAAVCEQTEDCTISDAGQSGTCFTGCAGADGIWTDVDRIDINGFVLTIDGDLTWDITATDGALGDCQDGELHFTEPGRILLPQGTGVPNTAIDVDCDVHSMNAGEYRQFGDATPVSQETFDPNEVLVPLGRVLPCFDGVNIDCETAANRDTTRILWPSAIYDVQGGTNGEFFMEESVAAVDPNTDWLCIHRGPSKHMCFPIDAVDPTAPDFSFEFDPAGGFQDPQAPLDWRRPAQFAVPATVERGSRVFTVDCDGQTSCFADNISALADERTDGYVGFYLSVYDANERLSGPYLISRTVYSSPNLTITLADDDGLSIDVLATHELIIEPLGLYEGTDAYVLHPLLFESATPTIDDSRIRFTGGTHQGIRGAIFRGLGTGTNAIDIIGFFTMAFSDIVQDLHAISSGGSIAHGGNIVDFNGITAFSELRRSSAQLGSGIVPAHTFRFVNSPGLNALIEVGTFFMGDDNLYFDDNNDGSHWTIRNSSVRFRPGNSDTLECIDSIGPGEQRFTVEDSMWIACTDAFRTFNFDVATGADTGVFRRNLILTGSVVVEASAMNENFEFFDLYRPSMEANVTQATNSSGHPVLPGLCTRCVAKDIHDADWDPPGNVTICQRSGNTVVRWEDVFVHDVTIANRCGVTGTMENVALWNIENDDPVTATELAFGLTDGDFDNVTVGWPLASAVVGTFAGGLLVGPVVNEITDSLFWNGDAVSYSLGAGRNTGSATQNGNCFWNNGTDVQGGGAVSGLIRNRAIRLLDSEHPEKPNLNQPPGSVCAGIGAQNAGIRCNNLVLLENGLDPENSGAGASSGGGGGGGRDKCRGRPSGSTP